VFRYSPGQVDGEVALKYILYIYMVAYLPSLRFHFCYVSGVYSIYLSPFTRIRIQLLGPCYKTGRLVPCSLALSLSILFSFAFFLYIEERFLLFRSLADNSRESTRVIFKSNTCQYMFFTHILTCITFCVPPLPSLVKDRFSRSFISFN